MGGDSYVSPPRTPGLFTRFFPGISFYCQLLHPVAHLCAMAQIGKCDDATWALDSARVARLLERVGCSLRIDGLEHITATEEPCVFVANHMSTLETFVLPSVIRPRRPVTFVVKKSLVTMPAFGPAMRARNPVVVGRVNPREDLHTVLEEGADRLSKGISIIVFPQSTRALSFDPAKFNTIGVKLAKRANVPVVPIALLTDAWGQGKKIKEFGKITPLPVYFRFGAPLRIQGQGKTEHAEICRFISDNLRQWQGMRP